MNMQPIFKNIKVQTVTISIISFAGGIALGYIFGKKNGTTYVVKSEVPKTDVVTQPAFSSRYAETLKEEEVERRYNEHHIPTMEEVDALEDGEVIETILVERESVTESNEVDGEWDYEVELSTRTPDLPYIIHEEEYMEDEMGYHQETLTYYQGDDIMADTDETPIYNYQGMMGELRFGHGTKDPSVVYIRNEKIHMEWEILLDEGTFSEEVLGLQLENDAEDELHHSVLKFRPE